MTLRFKARQRNSHAYSGGTSGAINSFNHDGVQIARVRRKPRELPLRQLLLFVVAVVSFKIFLFLDMGAAAYGQKVSELAGGTLLERVASRAMVMDPVSEWFLNGVRFGRW